MGKAEPSQPIGECICPTPGCTQIIKVRKYRERSSRGSMFKGKFYGRCDLHGRVIDAASPASQEYLLQRGTIWGPPGTHAPAAQSSQEPLPSRQETARTAQENLPVRIEPAPTPRSWVERLRGWDLWSWWPMRDD